VLFICPLAFTPFILKMPSFIPYPSLSRVRLAPLKSVVMERFPVNARLPSVSTVNPVTFAVA
jgi:hypothetical protein